MKSETFWWNYHTYASRSASAGGLYKETAFTGFMDILSGVSNNFKFSLFNYLKVVSFAYM